MKKILMTVALMALALSASAQATKPQNTFSNAVNINSPSLWLNFNDPTASFKDQVSQGSFTGKTAYPIKVSNSCVNTPGSSVLTTNCTLTTAAAGDTIIVFADSQTSTVSSLADSLGATAVEAKSSGSNSIWYFQNVAAGSHVITLTLSSATAYPVLQVTDVSGAAQSSPIDTSNINVVSSSSTSFTSGSITTANPNEMLVGFVLGTTNTYSLTSHVFTALSGGSWTGIFQAYLLASTAGSYAFTGNQTNASGYTAAVIAVKPLTSSSPVVAQQPGFDATNASNYSAEFPWSTYNVAPNNTLSTIDWNSPWTMLIHVDQLNWDRTGTLVLASKGDIGSTNNSYWELYLHQNSGLSPSSQLCFLRNGYGEVQAQQSVCTAADFDAMPNGFNYDIVVEDTGTGYYNALSLYLNGTSVLQTNASNTYSNGFGNVGLTVSGGTGYATSTAFTSTGGGANCVATGTMIAVSGVPTSINTNGGANYGCTSNPSIVLTSPTGAGAVITAAAAPMSMNSSADPLLVPGYVSNGVYYGAGGTDISQNPVYVDEFALFPGKLSFGQVTNIFYETKFYQGELYPFTNPPLVILGGYGCGPDFSGDQTVAMTIGAAKAGLIKLIGVTDDDGNPNGSNSVGWWRQMLDQAGLADVPLSVGPGSITANTGGCPAAIITAYNASTPQNASSYESSVTMYRKLFAEYPGTPIYVLATQTANGYAAFVTSPADSISPLTGLQLQAQNATNGGYLSLFQGNLGLTPSALTTVLTDNGSLPIYINGGTPSGGGPGILVSRTANDPLYLVASEMTSDSIAGWTNQNIAQVISPFFTGGVIVTYSGGTGYANSTPFTSTGGGSYCHVTGIMTASGGVPNGIETNWGVSFPSSTTYNGLGYGCTSAPTIVLRSPMGTGVTLTASTTFAVTCYGPSGCTNQYVVWPNQYAQPTSSATTAPIFTWFQNSLMDPPVVGQPRTH